MYNSSIPKKAYDSKLNDTHFHTTPTILKNRSQWVVWKKETIGGEEKKPPYNPRTGYKASPIDTGTWGAFTEALAAYASGSYEGIGYVFSPGDPFCGIDLDHCRDPQSGEVEPWAQEIVNALSSYTEISPSGNGLHIIIQGTLPGTQHRGPAHPIELYDAQRYFTFSGNHLEGTPTTIEARQRELEALYRSLFPPPAEKHSGGDSTADPKLTPAAPGNSPPHQIVSLEMSDEDLLARARSASNGAVFSRLYAGDITTYTTKGKPDPSRADLALCSLLAFWTRGDEARIDRLFRRSALMRHKWDERRGTTTYGERTIALAIKNRPGDYDPKPPGPPKQPKRAARYVTHAPQVKTAKQEETPEERNQTLARIGEAMKSLVKTHIENTAGELLVITAPPGVGKSHAVAELGEQTTVHPEGEYNLAWIAERRESVVPALRHYLAVQPCTRQNCPYDTLHTTIAERGYNTWSIHANHIQPCDYSLQFRRPGSKIYHLPHVRTRYPTQHQGIVIDELDITKWLPEREISIHKLHNALVSAPQGSSAELLLVSLQAVIADTQRANTELHGKALFDALDARCNHRLYSLLSELRNTKAYENTHPWAPIDIDAPDVEQEAHRLPPVVLPHILAALDKELLLWQSGTAWNSMLRIGPGKYTWSLFITEPLTFTKGDQALPPKIILDATADEELLRLLFGNTIQMSRQEITPTPGTHHIAIRTGKRYGKYSLCKKRQDERPPDLSRAIAECRFFLRQYDPTGQLCEDGKVGLITFAACEQEMREALHIPEGKSGHFWAMRGSNSLEECEILLVIGTPTLRPSEIARLARALWHADQAPIDDSSSRDPDSGTWRYNDPRMQRLSEYMTRAELTQCAHRNRPLKHPNRTILTFCLGEIDYLPPTHTYTQLPQLTPTGEELHLIRQAEEEARLERAFLDLQERGETPSVRALKTAAHISTDKAAQFLRTRLGAQNNSVQVEASDHAPPLCFSSVPHNTIEISYSNGRYSEAVQTAPEECAAPLLISYPPCPSCGGRLWRRRLDDRLVCRYCLGPLMRLWQQVLVSVPP